MVTTNQQRHFFLILLAGVVVLAFFVLEPFLIPLALGIIFSVILHPLYSRLTRVTRGRESLAAFLTVLVAVLVVGAAAGLLGARVISEAQQFFSGTEVSRGTVVSMAERAAPIIGRYIPGAEAQVAEAAANIEGYARAGVSWLAGHIGTAFAGLASALLSLFVFFVSLYYLLRDGSALRKKLIDLSPLTNIDDEMVFGRLGLAVNSVVKGQLSIAFIQSVLTGIGFAIFGVPSPALWGMVAFLAALVPSVGTALVIAPAVAFLLFTGSIGMGIGLAIWGILAVGLIDNFLAPRLISQGMQLHPLLVLLAVLGGIALFGAAGIFLGPLTLSLLFALLSLNKYLIENSQAA